MSAFDLFQIQDTILSGQALGAGIQVNGCHPVRLVMPAAWDAASITLQESPDNATWQNLYDNNGGEITVQAAASRTIVIPPSLLPGLIYLRLRSGTSGAPVNQTANRIVTWYVKKYGGSS